MDNPLETNIYDSWFDKFESDKANLKQLESFDNNNKRHVVSVFDEFTQISITPWALRTFSTSIIKMAWTTWLFLEN